MQRLVVVVSGLPGSGKTTLAGPLAQALGLPLLDKDHVLESLFDSLGCSTPQERQRLSRAADAVLLRLAGDVAAGAVLCSFWRHPGLVVPSGTPRDRLGADGAVVVEVRCVCPPETAAARFTARTRHPGHLDGSRAAGDLVDQLARLEALGPLGVGPLVEVDTSPGRDVDVAAVADLVRRRAG